MVIIKLYNSDYYTFMFGLVAVDILPSELATYLTTGNTANRYKHVNYALTVRRRNRVISIL